MVLANGFHRVSTSDYLADRCCDGPTLSASIAHVLDRQSPLHAYARHPRLGGAVPKERAAYDTGSLMHALLLGQGKEVVVIAADDWRTKAAKEQRDQARARGFLPVLEADYEAAKATAERLDQRFAEHGIELRNGDSEITALWTETTREGAQVQCRGMLDHLQMNVYQAMIRDLKSCRSAHPEACQRHVDAYGYAIQRAAYVSAVEHLRPELAGRVDFVFLFFELEEPFAIYPARLSGEFRALGERRWRRAVDTWKRCLRENRWPGYADGIAEIAPPPWAMKSDVDRQVAEAASSWSSEVTF